MCQKPELIHFPENAMYETFTQTSLLNQEGRFWLLVSACKKNRNRTFLAAVIPSSAVPVVFPKSAQSIVPWASRNSPNTRTHTHAQRYAGVCLY